MFYLRYPIIFIAGYTTVFVLFPCFFNTKQAQNEYTINHWNQDVGKLYFDIGQASQKRKDFASAIQAYKKALENNPYYLECYDALGICYELCKQLDQALQIYLKAMSVSPSFVETRTMTSDTLPPTGPIEPTFFPERRKWNGETLSNKIMYVYTEGGLGDTIFFLRFLNQLVNQEQKTKIIFQPQPALYTLVKNNLIPNIAVLSHSDDQKNLSFDYCTSLHKISSLLKTNYNGIPLSNGYINANKAKALVFKKAFFDNNFFKVGIFWQGNPNHLNDKNRSISLRFFYPITTISGVMVYSLQKKHGLEQLMSLPQEASIVNLDQYLHNFDDLAAAIVNLDLLISIDSSVAHLGGALGKTTWILLPKISDWRWFGYSEGDECCWYTHMKKFRQRHVGVWQDVFTDIINQIKQRVKKGT